MEAAIQAREQVNNLMERFVDLDYMYNSHALLSCTIFDVCSALLYSGFLYQAIHHLM